MRNETTYIMINTSVKLALRRMREDPERTIRNLVDMAQHFSGGRFQKHFFELAQICLQREDSPYYQIAIDTVSHVDPEILLQFGMNLGYVSCTRGADLIRRIEAEKGFNIPWTVFMQLPDSFPRHCMDRYQTILRQGEEMGIYTWMLFASGHPQSALPFVQQHPDSAFALFCDPRDINLTFLDCASELNNLMIVLRLTEDAETACSLLRAAGMLYSVYYPYTEKDAGQILDDTVFRNAKPLHPVFTVLLPQASCPEQIRSQVYETVQQMRRTQNFASLPFDMFGDCNFIDSIISDDSCIAGFDDKGCLICVHGRMQEPKYNLFSSDLDSIFHLAFPKPPETAIP